MLATDLVPFPSAFCLLLSQCVSFRLRFFFAHLPVTKSVIIKKEILQLTFCKEHFSSILATSHFPVFTIRNKTVLLVPWLQNLCFLLCATSVQQTSNIQGKKEKEEEAVCLCCFLLLVCVFSGCLSGCQTDQWSGRNSGCCQVVFQQLGPGSRGSGSGPGTSPEQNRRNFRWPVGLLPPAPTVQLEVGRGQQFGQDCCQCHFLLQNEDERRRVSSWTRSQQRHQVGRLVFGQLSCLWDLLISLRKSKQYHQFSSVTFEGQTNCFILE